MSFASGAGPSPTRPKTRRTITNASVRTTMTDSLPDAVLRAHRPNAEVAPFTDGFPVDPQLLQQVRAFHGNVRTVLPHLLRKVA